jgi:hypothetical protein
MNHLWEYHTALFEVLNGLFSGFQLDEEQMRSRLNALGNEGWELVSVTPIKQSSGHGTAALLASFKRPLNRQ